MYVIRPQQLAVQDRALQVRREFGVAVDHTVRVRFELLSVWLLRPPVRHPLRKQRHDVVALRAERAVEHRGYDAVRERPARRLPAPRVLKSLLYVVYGVGELYGPAEMLPSSGVGVELRERREREVELDDPAARVPTLDAAHEVVGELLAPELLEEGDARVRRSHHAVGPQLLAAPEHDAHDASVPLQDALDRRLGADLSAELLGRAPQSVGDRAHPSPRVAPGAESQPGVPDLVVH
jgi:hypothetical protein